MDLHMKLVIMVGVVVLVLVVIAGIIFMSGGTGKTSPTLPPRRDRSPSPTQNVPGGTRSTNRRTPDSPSVRRAPPDVSGETDEGLKKKFQSIINHAGRSKSKGIPKAEKAIALIPQLSDEVINKLSVGKPKLAENLKALKPRHDVYEKAIPIICKDVMGTPKISKSITKICSAHSGAPKVISQEDVDFISDNRATLDSLGVSFPSIQHIRNFLMRHTKRSTEDIVNDFERAYSEYLTQDYTDDLKNKVVSLYEDVISRLSIKSAFNDYPKYQSKSKFGDFAVVTLKKNFEDAYLKYRTSNPGKDEAANKPAAIQAFLRLKPFSSGKHNQVYSAKSLDDYLPEVDFFPSLLKDRIQKFEASCNSDSLNSARKAYKEYKDRLNKHINEHRFGQSELLQHIPESERKAVQEFLTFDDFFHAQALKGLTLAVDNRDATKIDLALQCVRLVTKPGDDLKSLLDDTSSTKLLAEMEEITEGPKTEEDFQKFLSASKAIHYAMKSGTHIFAKYRIALSAFREFYTYCNGKKELWNANKLMIKDLICSYSPFFADLEASDIDRFNIVPSKDMLLSPGIKPEVYLRLFPMQDFSKCMNDQDKCVYWSDIPDQNLQSAAFLESPDVLVMLYSHDGAREFKQLPYHWLDYLLKTELPMELSSLPAGPMKPFKRARYLCTSLLWMYQVQQAVFWEMMETESNPKLVQLKQRYSEVLAAVEAFDWKTDMRETDEFIDGKLNYKFKDFGFHLDPHYADILMEKKYYEKQRRYFDNVNIHKQLILEGFNAPLFDDLPNLTNLADTLGLTPSSEQYDFDTFITSLLDLFYLAAEPLEFIQDFEHIPTVKDEVQYHNNWLYRIRAPLIMMTGPKVYVRQLRHYIHRMNDYAAVTDYKPFVNSNDWGTIYYGVKKGTKPNFDTNLTSEDLELVLSSLMTWGGSWVNLFQSDSNLKLLKLVERYQTRNLPISGHLELRTINSELYHRFRDINRECDTDVKDRLGTDAEIKKSMEGYVQFITGPQNLDSAFLIPEVTYIKQDGTAETSQGMGEGMKRILMSHLSNIFKFLTYHEFLPKVSISSSSAHKLSEKDVRTDRYMSRDVLGLGPQHHADFYKLFATLVGKNIIMKAPMQIFVYPDEWEWLMTSPKSANGPVEKEFEGYEYDWLLWFPKLSVKYDTHYFWASDMKLVPDGFFKPDGSPDPTTDFELKPVYGDVDDLSEKTAQDWFEEYYSLSASDIRKNIDKVDEVVQCNLKYFMKRMIQGRKSFQKRTQEYFGRQPSEPASSEYAANEIVADMDSVAHLGCQLFPLDAEKLAQAVERNASEYTQYWVKYEENTIGIGKAMGQMIRDFGREEGRFEQTSDEMSQALMKGFLSLFNGRPTLPSGGYDKLKFTLSYESTSATFTGIKSAVCFGTMKLPNRKPKIVEPPPSTSSSTQKPREPPPKGEPVTSTQPIKYEDLYEIFKASCLSSLTSGDAVESYRS